MDTQRPGAMWRRGGFYVRGAHRFAPAGANELQSVFPGGMRFGNYGAPAQTQQGGLRGERRGKGAGGVFAIRLAETEQSGLCPDDFSAHKRANPVLILCHLFRNASISTTRPP